MLDLLQLDPLAATITLAAAVVALFQLKIGRASNRQSETMLSLELKREWLGMKNQWHAAILSVNGPDSYYSPASPEIRKKYYEMMSYLDAQVNTSDNNTWKEGRVRSHYFEQATRDCIFFLDSLAMSVLSGKMSPDTAYSIVGPEIPRRGAQIRLMLGEGAHGQVPHSTYFTVSSYPGMKDRILALVDMLWAEAARLHDLSGYEVVGVAEGKRKSGSGDLNRKRIRKLVENISTGFFNKKRLAIKLDNQLLWAQIVSLKDDAELFGHPAPKRILRGGKLGWWRKLRIWANGFK